ncbi:MAG: nuclear transport factor 2 family protein [Xanthomonadales bacterium]|nr:nuclear transport factor 2 family protein [Xanthomonadales bacterium]
MKLKLSENILQAVSTTIILFLLTSTAYTQTSDNSASVEGIQLTLSHYFNGRRSADLELLQQAYDPGARLESVNAEGEIQRISFDDYLQVVKSAGPVEVKTSILEISIVQSIAIAQTRFDYGQRVYYDYLTLLKTTNGWKITNKAYARQHPDNDTGQDNK